MNYIDETTILIHIGLTLMACALSALLGYYFAYIRGALVVPTVHVEWKDNPKPHHKADARHAWVILDDDQHAFTYEALAEAQQRAKRLNKQ